LQNTGRVPSFRAIAIAILKNDFPLKSLGFMPDENQFCKDVRESKKISLASAQFDIDYSEEVD